MVRQRATVPKCLGGTPPPEKLLSTDSDGGACGRGWRGQSGLGARRRHARFESGAKVPWQSELGWARWRDAGAPTWGGGLCRPSFQQLPSQPHDSCSGGGSPRAPLDRSLGGSRKPSYTRWPIRPCWLLTGRDDKARRPETRPSESLGLR